MESSKKNLFLLLAIVILVTSINIHFALLGRTDVPVVDGWPVLHRLMMLEGGRVSWLDYIFGLHGAHLHAIIYFVAWLDFRWLGGQQELQSVLSLAAVAAFAVFLSTLLAREGMRKGHGFFLIALGVAATAAMVSSICDTESLLMPFQAVLTISRLAYMVLLYLIIYSIIEKDFKNYCIFIAMSAVVVTFHGSGHLFAFCIILLHVLLRVKAGRLLFAVIPMLSALIIQKIYSTGGGELTSLHQVLDLRVLVQLPLAFIAYFAMPFIGLLNIADGKLWIFAGSVLASSTLLLTAAGLCRVLGLEGWSPVRWVRQIRTLESDRRPLEVSVVFFTVVGLLVLMSAVAAAVFCFIRSLNSGVQAWQIVFDGARYNAYSLLSCVMPIAFLLYKKANGKRTGDVGAVAITAGILVFGLSGILRMPHIQDTNDRVNLSVAAISVGLNPTVPRMTDDIWLGVHQDWFWRDQLPATIDWLRRTQRGPWRDIPPLNMGGGVSYVGMKLNVASVVPLPVESAPGWCRVDADVISQEGDYPPRSTLITITNSDGGVVGFGVVTGRSAGRILRKVQGITDCRNAGKDLFANRRPRS